MKKKMHIWTAYVDFDWNPDIVSVYWVCGSAKKHSTNSSREHFWQNNCDRFFLHQMIFLFSLICVSIHKHLWTLRWFDCRLFQTKHMFACSSGYLSANVASHCRHWTNEPHAHTDAHTHIQLNAFFVVNSMLGHRLSNKPQYSQALDPSYSNCVKTIHFFDRSKVSFLRLVMLWRSKLARLQATYFFVVDSIWAGPK